MVVSQSWLRWLVAPTATSFYPGSKQRVASYAFQLRLSPRWLTFLSLVRTEWDTSEAFCWYTVCQVEQPSMLTSLPHSGPHSGPLLFPHFPHFWRSGEQALKLQQTPSKWPRQESSTQTSSENKLQQTPSKWPWQESNTRASSEEIIISRSSYSGTISNEGYGGNVSMGNGKRKKVPTVMKD